MAPLAEQVWQRLGTALSQWCGPLAYHSVLTRAVNDVGVAMPAMAPLRVSGPPTVILQGFDDVEAAHGGVVLTAGVQALLSALIAVLVRVIGEEMAINVVSTALQPPGTQRTSPSTRPVVDS